MAMENFRIEVPFDRNRELLEVLNQLEQRMGKLEDRIITMEPTQQQPSQNGSSWAGTLFKVALVSAALAGAAYIGYRQGFVAGAEGMFDTIREYAEKASSYYQASSVPESFSPGAETTTAIVNSTGAAVSIAKGVGASAVSFPNDMEALKQLFIKETMEKNPLMRGEMPTFEMPYNTTKISNAVTDLYYTTRNEILFLGAIGVTYTGFVIGLVTQCLRAAWGH